MKIKVHKPTLMKIHFDELLDQNGRVRHNSQYEGRMFYELQPGDYTVESYEPYTMQYLETLIESGDCTVEQVYMHEHIYAYICRLIQATRDNTYVDLGISPRGTIALVRIAKAWAFLRERNYVTPGDVYQVFKDVGKHRIVLNTKARVSHITEEAVLQGILEEVKQPTTYMEKKDYCD